MFYQSPDKTHHRSFLKSLLADGEVAAYCEWLLLRKLHRRREINFAKIEPLNPERVAFFKALPPIAFVAPISWRELDVR
jgi:hypothetical protein